MKGLANLIAIALAVAVPAGSPCATEISGNVVADTTWAVGGSPYVVVGDVRVKGASTLSIDPGVEVRFDGAYEIYVEGGSSLVAEGTPSARIVFTSNAPSPTPTDWKNVFIFDSPSSSFRHCVFEYAAKGLYLNNSSPPIERCRFSSCQIGIWCHASSPAITGSEIVDSSSVGIFCLYSSSVPTVNDCNLEGNATASVYLSSYNVLPVVTIDATGNWWGTDDPAEIGAAIYDNEDKESIFGVVDYADWLTAPGVEASSWGSIKALFRE